MDEVSEYYNAGEDPNDRNQYVSHNTLRSQLTDVIHWCPYCEKKSLYIYVVCVCVCIYIN